MTDFAQRFELAHRARDSLVRCMQFLKQPHVLDGDHCLVGKGFKEGDLLPVNGRTSVDESE